MSKIGLSIHELNFFFNLIVDYELVINEKDEIRSESVQTKKNQIHNFRKTMQSVVESCVKMLNSPVTTVLLSTGVTSLF